MNNLQFTIINLQLWKLIRPERNARRLYGGGCLSQGVRALAIDKFQNTIHNRPSLIYYAFLCRK